MAITCFCCTLILVRLRARFAAFVPHDRACVSSFLSFVFLVFVFVCLFVSWLICLSVLPAVFRPTRAGLPHHAGQDVCLFVYFVCLFVSWLICLSVLSAVLHPPEQVCLITLDRMCVCLFVCLLRLFVCWMVGWLVGLLVRVVCSTPLTGAGLPHHAGQDAVRPLVGAQVELPVQLAE